MAKDTDEFINERESWNDKLKSGVRLVLFLKMMVMLIWKIFKEVKNNGGL